MAILSAILNTLIVLTCLFLICLILIQRGKGGGLAGAFGGVGGSSAFGTKSGDVFTRVTMIVASVWIVLSMICVVLYNQGGQSAWGNDPDSAFSRQVAPKNPKAKEKAPAGGTSRPDSNAPASTSPAASPSPSGPVSVPAIPETATPSPATKK